MVYISRERILMKIFTKAFALVMLVGTPVMAQDQFDLAFKAYTDELAATCAAFDEGELTAAPEAVRKVVDVNGDGVTDPIVDAGSMECSSSATLTGGGTGGRDISVFVSQENGEFQRFEFLGYGMMPLTLGPNTVLIMPKHPTTCGLNGPAPCFAAYTWAENGFVAGGDKVEISAQ